MRWSQEVGDQPCRVRLSLGTCQGSVPGPPPPATTNDAQIHRCPRPVYTLAKCLHVACVRGQASAGVPTRHLMRVDAFRMNADLGFESPLHRTGLTARPQLWGEGGIRPEAQCCRFPGRSTTTEPPRESPRSQSAARSTHRPAQGAGPAS